MECYMPAGINTVSHTVLYMKMIISLNYQNVNFLANFYFFFIEVFMKEFFISSEM